MKKADLIIIGVVAIIVGIIVFFLYFVGGEGGQYVQVEIDGKIVDTIKLDEDFEKEYKNGEDSNKLEIKDGKATMISANCPDGICVNHKPIYRNGESIICLPHKMVVTITVDSSTDDEIDAVA